LQKKVQILEEEKSEIKNDFYIKINSFMDEISILKNKLSSKILLSNFIIIEYESI
jgi:hypothetical protein